MIPREKIKLITAIVLSALLVCLGIGGYFSWHKAKSITEEMNSYRYDEKVLDFTKMYIGLVLKSDGAIQFEDRLKLENAVRAIGDNQILAQWKAFTQAQKDMDVETGAKALLNLLLNKIDQ